MDYLILSLVPMVFAWVYILNLRTSLRVAELRLERLEERSDAAPDLKTQKKALQGDTVARRRVWMEGEVRWAVKDLFKVCEHYDMPLIVLVQYDPRDAEFGYLESLPEGRTSKRMREISRLHRGTEVEITKDKPLLAKAPVLEVLEGGKEPEEKKEA